MPRAPSPTPAELAVLDPDGGFRQRLSDNLDAITRLQAAGDLEAIRVVIHQLAGAAGTFGFTEIGDIALQIDALDDLSQRPTDLARLVAALHRAIAKKSA
ncbi:MAG: Hpt domain-containing protein [Devosia sp.]